MSATINRRSSRIGAKFSRPAWLALFLQRRRRLRAAGQAPSEPVFSGYSLAWDQTDIGWTDVNLEFSFNHGLYPPATLELWFKHEGEDPPILFTTFPSTDTSYLHGDATQVEENLYYQLRYVDGDVIGPFSSEFQVAAGRPPATPGDLQADSVGGSMLVLSWNMDDVSGEAGCYIEGRVGAAAFAVIGNTGPGFDFFNYTVPSSGSWEFRVRAYNGYGYSEYTNVAEAFVG